MAETETQVEQGTWLVIAETPEVTVVDSYYDQEQAKRRVIHQEDSLMDCKVTIIPVSQAAAAPELLKAVQLFQRFFDEMPYGQFAKISCDIALMNDAFIASRKAITKATQSR